MSTVTLSPRNSILLVMDESVGEGPASIGDGLIASTQSCVVVGTLAEMDGETTVTLTDSAEGLELGDLVFDGLLKTPAKELSVFNTDNERLLTIALVSSLTSVQIFTNDSNEPDRIIVLVASKNT